MKRKQTTPTMKDVASEAGVALGTVSKVFNNIPVGESYKERVLAAAEKLGYQVNVYARGLKTNRTNTIAVILPSVRHTFFGTLADAICRELHSRGYKMYLSVTEYDQEAEQECIHLVQQNKVDGIIGLTYNPDLQVSEDIPFVTIDRYFSASVPCISSDNFNGGQIAAQKLVELGCHRLLCLQSSSRVPGEADKRLSGFISWCELNDVPYETLRKIDVETYAAFGEYLQSQIKDGVLAFDGIFCGTDHLADYVITALRSSGIRVPEDVQVIGFDGIRKFGLGSYYCSTIVQPVEAMARSAVDTVLSENRNALPALICLPVYYTSGGTTRD